MGLFDKKYCDVCGEKIGLLGNRKLEDGNLCKNCAKQLSPWFNERRHSSVEEIKAQLAYREENKEKVSQFRATRTIGDYWHVVFDENHRWFAVTKASSPNTNENPDILDYSAITGCRFDIDEDKNEIYRETKDGNKESYNPPRYEYNYNFNFVINVDNPYFDEIEFQLNCGTVNYEPEPTMQISLFGHSLTDSNANPENCAEYRKYRDMGQAICNELDRIRGISNTYTQPNGFQQAVPPVASATAYAAASSVPTSNNETWFCPNCGTQNTGKFCEGCGTPKPISKATSCARCGWAPEPGQRVPKFCPECGTQIS